MPPSLFERAADRVSLYEVSPRDGLQNESAVVPLDGKRRLIESLVASGLKRIEITSFVSPRWIPQLADADEIAKLLVAPPGVTFGALCPNSRGLERAMAVGMHEIAVFMSASETHNKKNINRSIDDTLAIYREVVPVARDAGMRVRAYVSTVWGCPYEGAVAPDRVLSLTHKLVDLGCYQVSLGDTIGVGTPRQTEQILGLLSGEFPKEKIALHFHDTRGTALANVLVSLQLGYRDFDASVGGLGGCPYAPGAAGNLATEDLVYMLQGMGIETGVDLDKLVQAALVAEQIVGRRLPGKVHQAGANWKRG